MNDNDKAKSGISRVAKGESVDDVLHALLGEARMGDPGELEKLYGHNFDHNDRIDAHPDLEVPTLLRQQLTSKGFRHHGIEDAGTDYERHTYHHAGKNHEIAVSMNPPSDAGSAPGLSWSHLDHNDNNFVGDGVGLPSLLTHLTKL